MQTMTEALIFMHRYITVPYQLCQVPSIVHAADTAGVIDSVTMHLQPWAWLEEYTFHKGMGVQLQHAHNARIVGFCLP